MLANPVKMVVWDLDETFWSRTLSEGEVAIPPRHADILKQLTACGIVSSICSKNDFETAKRELERHDLWRNFVFPVIAFDAKGPAIAALVESANLRPEKCPPHRRQPAESARGRILRAGSDDGRARGHSAVAAGLARRAGANDPEHVKLPQYKQIETKIAARSHSQSNEDFLRQCDIGIEIDIDVEPHIDRIIDLINKSNQLNFTKVRLHDEKSRHEFRALLRKYGSHAGIVRASDKYGDYGIIGFFLTTRHVSNYACVHFVFSCRIMNMGIEQYVYELLGRPTCRIVEPVVPSLAMFAKVDWIALNRASETSTMPVSNAKLVFIGGCDLLQVSANCSANRSEYVNVLNKGVMVRYDDFGFLLSPRESLRASATFRRLPSWSYEEAVRLDADLAEAEVVVVSLLLAFAGNHFVIGDDVFLRTGKGPPSLAEYVAKAEADATEIRRVRIPRKSGILLLSQALDRLAATSPKASTRVVLGAFTRGFEKIRLEALAYNAAARDYCERSGAFAFLDINDLIPDEAVLDGEHFARRGYFNIASEINARVAANRGAPIGEARNVEDAEFDLRAFLASLAPAPIVAN